MLKYLPYPGYSKIYVAECFKSEFEAAFGKNQDASERCRKHLRRCFYKLEKDGADALGLYEQFEHIQDTKNPKLYAIRHPNSKYNERHIFVFAKDECVILLTSFLEKSGRNYYGNDKSGPIAKAINIYNKLEGL